MIGLFYITYSFTQTDTEYDINPGGKSWGDSYQANGLCWCDSTYDHGLNDVNVTSFMINGIKRNIKDICDELKKHPLVRDYQDGDSVYNDIQCGNGPANSDSKNDETYCPGIVTDGNSGCTITGPTWDLTWLASRPIFGGNGDLITNQILDNGNYYIETPYLNERLHSDYGMSYNAKMEVDNTDGNSQIWNFIHLGDNIYSIRNETNYRYLEVNNASCSDAGNVGTWFRNENEHQKWKIVANGSNYSLLPLHCQTKALDRSQGVSGAEAVIYDYATSNDNQKWNLVSVEDVIVPPSENIVTIMAETISNYVSFDSEYPNYVSADNSSTNNTFEMETNADGTVSFKSSTGKYISSENSSSYVTCNRATATPGTWERFELELLTAPNVYAIKWKNNQGIYTYLSHEFNRSPMNCNRPGPGTWERFVIETVTTHSSVIASKNVADSKANVISTTFFPNPVTNNDVLGVQVVLNESTAATIQILDLSGRLVAEKKYPVLESGINFVTLSEIQKKVATTGVYVLKITSNEQIVVKKVQFNIF